MNTAFTQFSTIGGFIPPNERVGGYNLNEFTRTDRPFNLSRLMVGSEGTLGVVLEATIQLVPLPTAKAVMAIEFAELLQALEAAPLILRHHPSAVEVMDRFILDYTKQNAELQRRRQTFIAGDPGALLCVEFYADRAQDLPPRLDALDPEVPLDLISVLLRGVLGEARGALDRQFDGGRLFREVPEHDAVPAQGAVM